MKTTRHIPAKLAVAASIAAFGAASIAAYRPGGVTDRDLATESLKRAVASLGNAALDTNDGLNAYRDGLRESDALLRRAIRSHPTDTASIERLATVGWESGVLAGGQQADSLSPLMAIAATRAPRVSVIQADLGALLYKMGRSDEAAACMKRAVALSPTMTSRVVTRMLEVGMEPNTILATLPPTAETVLALRDPTARTGDWSDWLVPVERLLPEHPRDLMISYTDACLASNESTRLLDHVMSLGVLADKGAEAERQIAIGRAYVVQKAMTLAAGAAAKALDLSPTDPRLLELVGQVAFLAGDSAKAETSFRDALSALAQSGIQQNERARLYRERGQALEQLGRVEEAFDEYRRAVEIEPDDPWLRQRFAATTARQGWEGLR